MGLAYYSKQYVHVEMDSISLYLAFKNRCLANLVAHYSDCLTRSTW